MHVPSETEAAVVYYFKINAVLRCCMLQVVRCEGQTVSEKRKTTNHNTSTYLRLSLEKHIPEYKLIQTFNTNLTF